MLRKKLFIGVLALGIAPMALANGDMGYAAPAPAYNPGVYVGLQAGYALTHWDNVDVNDVNTFNLYRTNNEDGFAGRVFAGYDFHKNFAIEGGYTHFFNEVKINNPAGVNITKVKTYALDLVGKLKAPVMDQFGLYATAGVDYLHINHGLDTKSHSAFNVTYGVGGYYDFNQNVTADISWKRFGGDSKVDKDYQPFADLFAVGVSYKFNLS